MAEQEIAFGVKIDGVERSINSIKDLKNAIKAAKDEQVKAAAAFGQGSQEYQNASKKLGELKDSMDDLNDSTQSLRGSGVESLSSSFGMLGDGFKNLDLDKIKTGFKGIGSAMSAIPLMLIVSGITMLAEKFGIFEMITDAVVQVLYAFTDAIGLTNKADEKAAAEMIENAQKVQKAKEAQYDKEIKLAKAAGQDVKELELEKIKSSEKSTQEQINKFEDLKKKKGKLNDDEQKQYDELQEKLLQISGDRIEKELQAEQAKQQQLTNLRNLEEKLRVAGLSDREKEIDAIKKQQEALMKELVDNHEVRLGVEKEDTMRYNEDVKKINELTQIEINKINAKYGKEAADKKKEQNEKNKADLDKRNEEYLKSQQDELANLKQRLLTEDLLRQKEREDYFNLEELKRKDKNKNKLLDAELNALNNKENVDAQIALLEAKRQIELQNLELTNTERAIINKKYADQEDGLKKQQAEKEKALEKAKQDEIVKIIEQSLGSAQNLSDIFFLYKKNKAEKGSKEELDLARKQFNVNKALQLGFALMDSYKAITASIAQSPVAIGPVPNPAGIASLAFAITTSAANIAKIASTKFDGGSASGGGGGGGGSAPSVPSIPPPPTIATPENNTNKTTSFDETGKNLNFQGTPTPTINVTATVGVDEITSKSNRVEVLEQQSTF